MHSWATAEAPRESWRDPVGEGSILGDDVLLQICGVPDKDPQITPEWMSQLRMVPGLLEPRRSQPSLRLEAALTHLASLLGKLTRFNPTHFPFGYEGPVVSPEGWIDRGILDLVGKQIVGLRWRSASAEAVAGAVRHAISEAIRLGFLAQKAYDAWRPGMPSGSGWRSAVTATPYGVIKANQAVMLLSGVTSTEETRLTKAAPRRDIHASCAPPSAGSARKEQCEGEHVTIELGCSGPHRSTARAGVAARAEANAVPEAAKHRAVQLGRPGEPCLVLGRQKKPLTDGQHAVVSALLRAGEEGLNKDAMEAIRPSARRILRKLREDGDWAEVVLLPGQTNGRYRIRV